MSKPPTLADSCIATALHKIKGAMRQPPDVKRVLLQVANARKFVLDKPMSEYLADLSISFWRGNTRKQHNMLENARQMARLPHALTWIEFDYADAHRLRLKQLGALKIVDSHGNEPCKFGWLIRQHTQVETAFMATEIRSSTAVDGAAFTHPISVQWRADDGPLMWKSFEPREQVVDPEPILESEWIVQMEHYQSSQVGWTVSFDESTSKWMLDMMVERNTLPYGRLALPRIPTRDIWALLATINDLPIRVEPVTPSKGYVARGSYRKFLQHSILHLTVPETQWRKLVAKSAVMLRRRAHQVRGHWRKDWRHPLSVLCEHVFDAQMACQKCQGRQLWVSEHQRGDASVGFVTHDYEIHHDR